LGDFDEKRWGQQLAKNERKRKRDSEVQEIFAAFRMVAVELINRVQNYRYFNTLPIDEAEAFIILLDIEIKALINMINDALSTISMHYSYSVPYIKVGKYYSIQTKNFSKKKEVENVEVDQPLEEVVNKKPRSIITAVIGELSLTRYSIIYQLTTLLPSAILSGKTSNYWGWTARHQISTSATSSLLTCCCLIM
jgi:hypothetical protein